MKHQLKHTHYWLIDVNNYNMVSQKLKYLNFLSLEYAFYSSYFKSSLYEDFLIVWEQFRSIFAVLYNFKMYYIFRILAFWKVHVTSQNSNFLSSDLLPTEYFFLIFLKRLKIAIVCLNFFKHNIIYNFNFGVP